MLDLDGASIAQVIFKLGIQFRVTQIHDSPVSGCSGNSDGLLYWVYEILGAQIQGLVQSRQAHQMSYIHTPTVRYFSNKYHQITATLKLCFSRSQAQYLAKKLRATVLPFWLYQCTSFVFSDQNMV